MVIGYFADTIIIDITAGQGNCYFAEIGPRRQNPLYGTRRRKVTITIYKTSQPMITSAIYSRSTSRYKYRYY